LVFVFGRLTGDPISVALGDRLPAEELQRRVAAAGYDRPVFQQLVDYLAGLLQGDFGSSFQSGKSVLQSILSYLPATIELSIVGIFFAILIAVPLGVVAAQNPGGKLDSIVRSSSIITYALPIFLVAIVLRLLFSIAIPIFPTTGRLEIANQIELTRSSANSGFFILDSILLGRMDLLVSALSHAFLPGLTIGLVIGASFLRILRSNIAYTMSTEPVKFAKTLGITRFGILRTHVAKLIAPQVLTSLGYSLAALVSGFVYVEVSFEWRGLGMILTESVLSRDFELLQGIVVFSVLLVVFVNTLVDITILTIDRRFRSVRVA
jgi:peptide/nickel transport system permease protein